MSGKIYDDDPLYFVLNLVKDTNTVTGKLVREFINKDAKDLSVAMGSVTISIANIDSSRRVTYRDIFFLFFLPIQSGHFHGNLWAKGDHLMEVSYLTAHPLEGRYPEWTPNFHSDRSQYSNLCSRGSQGPQSASGSTVPLPVSLDTLGDTM